MKKNTHEYFITKSGLEVAVEIKEIENMLSSKHDVITTINVDNGKKRKYSYSTLNPIKGGLLKSKKTGIRKNGIKRQGRAPILNNRLLSEINKLIGVLVNKYREYGVTFILENSLTKDQIFDYLEEYYGVDKNQKYFDTNIKSSMKPDGGILWMILNDGRKYPVLISEMKSQGQGLHKSRGNAIERAGKNIIGIDILLMFEEKITPFVIFAQGDDFKDDSTILGRASILNNSQELNNTNIISKQVVSMDGKNNPNQTFIKQVRRFAFMAREEEWNSEEILEVITDVAYQAIDYFLSK